MMVIIQMKIMSADVIYKFFFLIFFLTFKIVDFDRLSRKASINIVTKKIDPNALQNEISSKCFLNCPQNVDCSALTGSVEWTYSEDNTTSTTDLSYSTENKEFYSFLGHSFWETALGDSVFINLLF